MPQSVCQLHYWPVVETHFNGVLKQFMLQLDHNFCLGVNFVIRCKNRARVQGGSSNGLTSLHSQNSTQQAGENIVIYKI